MSRHLTDVLASGELDDYHPRPPGPSPIGLGWDVDAEICRESHCAACGRQGLEYRPFTRPGSPSLGLRASYRAFAVCPVCGDTQEF